MRPGGMHADYLLRSQACPDQMSLEMLVPVSCPKYDVREISSFRFCERRLRRLSEKSQTAMSGGAPNDGI